MKKTHTGLRIFESPILEAFSHVHPITPLVMWTPVIGVLLYRSFFVHALPVSGLLLCALAALFVWTLFEYLLHRFVFHWVGESAWSKRLHFIMHGNHHVDAICPTRLVMPPVPGIIIAAFCFAGIRAAVGPLWAEPFFGFFLIGYLIYDYTHYAIHHFTPLTRWGHWVKHHHMQHHYVNPESRWGVSSPLWDYVFATRAIPRDANKGDALPSAERDSVTSEDLGLDSAPRA